MEINDLKSSKLHYVNASLLRIAGHLKSPEVSKESIEAELGLVLEMLGEEVRNQNALRDALFVCANKL